MEELIIKHIIEQHAEDASSLWLQRDWAMRDPHYFLKDLVRLDDRLGNRKSKGSDNRRGQSN